MKKEIVKIKISKIIPNKNQPRLDFYDDSIKSLAESIKENGLLQPVTVRKSGNQYELIAGERRYRACLLNGQKDIEAIIMDTTDDESANLALVENLQREDLNAIEQALAMKRIMKTEKLTQNQLAEKLGYRQSTVANKLRLLKLPEYIKKAISQDVITERHARALLNIPSENLKEVYETIVKRNYTVSKTEEYVRELTTKHKRKGVSNNLKIGINTIKEAYELCKKSGIDADMNVSEYEDNVKIVIRMKK